MNTLKANDICKVVICDAYGSALYHQKLIDEWDMPNDVVQKAAVIIKNIHEMYGRAFYSVLKQLENNCQHPKKMQDICNNMRYCMNCNQDLGKVNVRNKVRKR